MSIALLNDPVAIAVILVALFLGGVLKGAIGIGAPVVAVPVMASFIDVRLAVVIMVVPNLCTNLWQIWSYRRAILSGQLPWVFGIAGAIGVAIGTGILAAVSAVWLKLLIAGAVVFYVALRLSRPDFAIRLDVAQRVAGPVGVIAGILQGAAGISAPVSASFLSAIKLSREHFITTISIFFVSMTLVQIPMLSMLGFMTLGTVKLGVVALLPLLVGMPIGTWLARQMNAKTFDGLILGMLLILSAKLVFDAALSP